MGRRKHLRPSVPNPVARWCDADRANTLTFLRRQCSVQGWNPSLSYLSRIKAGEIIPDDRKKRILERASLRGVLETGWYIHEQAEVQGAKA